MDTGSGHIFERDKIDIKSIKGKLVPWQIGEEVIIKDCKFKVKEIRVFPADEIVLIGQANDIFEQDLKEASQEVVKEPHGIMSFARNRK